MKYQPGIIAPGRLAYMYGVSQTGRTLRQIIYDGFTIDEQGRKVFDAAFIKTGGASMARFNERFALVNSLGVFTETQFPFQYQMTTDPVTGKRDGMGVAHSRRPRAEDRHLRHRLGVLGQGPPRRAAARVGRRHRGSCPTRPTCACTTWRDREHGSGTVPASDGGGQFKNNTLNYAWAERALMEALDAWVRQGQGAAREPPSAIRRRHDGAPPPAQVPDGARRAVADQRARRLSLGRRHARFADAVPALAGRCRRQRDGRHPPARAGGAARHDDRLAVPQRAHRRAAHPHRQRGRLHPVPGDAGRPREGGRSAAGDRGALRRAAPTTWRRSSRWPSAWPASATCCRATCRPSSRPRASTGTGGWARLSRPGPRGSPASAFRAASGDRATDAPRGSTTRARPRP